MKNVECTYCQGKHYQTFCPQKPKKPIKRSPINKKPLKASRAASTDGSTVKSIIAKKKPTRSQLIKKLDKVFSDYIREKDAIDGMATCITCGDTKEWKYQQNGHYMSRGNYATRWDETNCHVQCAACNVFKKGNYTEYAIYMINRYGAEKLTELKEKAKAGRKFTSVELQEMIEKYTK